MGGNAEAIGAERGRAGTQRSSAESRGAIFESDGARGSAAARSSGGHRGRERNGLAGNRGIGRGSQGGRGVGLVDGLGQRRGSVVAGGEIGVAAVNGCDGGRADGQRGKGWRAGAAAGESDRAAIIDAISLELDGAGGGARTWCGGADGGGESDRLTENRRVD